MKNNAFDDRFIDHTNEELMQHFFVKLAKEAGIERRPAELLFRNTWHILRRKLSADREDTFRIMRVHIKEA